MNLNSIAGLWNSFDLLEVKDILEEICEKYDYQIHEMTFPMIMIHAGVAIERIINHNYIKNQTISEKLESSREYQISYDFFTQVSTMINIELVTDEVILFALLLMGKRANDYRKDIIKEKLAVDVEHLVEAVIVEVKEYFDIDFSKENQLVSGGIFDSFDIIALTEEISDTFGVIIKPKQLTAENFDSVDAMMKLIESLK